MGVLIAYVLRHIQVFLLLLWFSSLLRLRRRSLHASIVMIALLIVLRVTLDIVPTIDTTILLNTVATLADASTNMP